MVNRRNPRQRFGPSRPSLGMALFLFSVFLVAASLVGSPARAEIYQWTDDQGTVHFADDLSSVPEKHRKKATLLVREPPSVIGGPAPAAPAGAPVAEEPSPLALPSDPEEVAREAEQLRAKIVAKESLIKGVNEKQSLATNPLRNRVVDPADLELFRKYQAELPADRERLRALESRLESLK